MTPFARRVKELLAERGWSIKELSRRMAAVDGNLATNHEGSLHGYFNGRVPRQEMIETTAAAFGVAVEELAVASLTAAEEARLRDLLRQSEQSHREALAALEEARRMAAEMVAAQRHPQELAKPGSTIQKAG